jgi:hypothetical protein
VIIETLLAGIRHNVASALMLGLDLNEKDGCSEVRHTPAFEQTASQPGARARAGLAQRAGSGRIELGQQRPA